MRVSNTSKILATVLLLGLWFGCGGPPASPGDGASGSSTEVPEITDDLINERINDAWIRDVPSEDGTAPPISWNFDYDEPKEVKVVEKQMNGDQATIVLDIKTSSAPRARANRQLAGQIRTKWRLKTGWVMRRWEIVDSDNISMKYKDLPMPSPPAGAPDSNRR
ncbi:MAG TPA: hypothetical protein VNA22_01375 [Pyrinomonadaceae bacterium]|nr:hypothetical protein [Pyrinomonadaceae bacterium]